MFIRPTGQVPGPVTYIWTGPETKIYIIMFLVANFSDLILQYGVIMYAESNGDI